MNVEPLPASVAEKASPKPQARFSHEDDSLEENQPNDAKGNPASPSAPVPDELLTVSIPCSTKEVDAIDAWLGGNKPATDSGIQKPGRGDATADYDWHTPDMATVIKPSGRQTKAEAAGKVSNTQKRQHPEGRLATSSLSEEGRRDEASKDTTEGGNTGDMDGRQDKATDTTQTGASAADGKAADEKKESILSGISMSQVTAGALAAVTSLLLSSQIGIAGSVIGVAIASVISTVSGQVYKVMLSRSADKLKAMAQAAPINVPIIGTTKDSEDGEGMTGGTPDIDATMTSSEIPEELSFHDGVTERVPRVGGTQADASSKRGSNGSFKTQPVGGIGNWDIEQDGMRVAPKALRVAAAEREREDMKRKVIVFTVIASLVAVLLTAGIITLVTNGNGIGEKTPSIVQTVTGSGTAPRNANVTDDGTAAVNGNVEAAGNFNANMAGNENAEADGYGKYGYGYGHSRNQNADATTNENGTGEGYDESGKASSGVTSSSKQEATSEDDSDGKTQGSQGGSESGTTSSSGNGSTSGTTSGNKNTGNGSASSSSNGKNETSGSTTTGGSGSNGTNTGSGTGTGNSGAGAGSTGTTDTGTE